MRSTERTATAAASPTPAPREPAIGPRIDPELAGELVGGPWQYPWELTPAIDAPVTDPLARQIAWAREAMIEPYALDAFALDAERTALDLSCGEGRLAQRLLDWGARHVLALSADPESLHRAILLRRHFAIDPGRLELRACDETHLDRHGRDFDVVLLLDARTRETKLEAAARLCRGVCALECSDADADEVAAAALAAGFAVVERAAPPVHAPPPFLLGEREILVARARGAA